MKRITSIQMLKEEASSKKNGGYTEFFISLKGGARSSKGLIYYPDTNTFDVYNDIDGSFEDDLTEEQLINETHIGDAIELGAFFKY